MKRISVLLLVVSLGLASCDSREEPAESDGGGQVGVVELDKPVRPIYDL